MINAAQTTIINIYWGFIMIPVETTRVLFSKNPGILKLVGPHMRAAADFRMMEMAMVIMISEVGEAPLAGEIATLSMVIPMTATRSAARGGINKRGIFNE